MAADILIVDDEADIRDLVAGILEDEGHQRAAGARQRRGAEGDRGAAAASRRARHLAAGQPPRRARGAVLHQAHLSRPAGRHHLRPRQHRDGRHRHQARRLRLHREAVQGRPADPRHAARARSLAAEARGEGAARAFELQRRHDRQVAGHQPAAQRARPRGADQQPHPHPRLFRLRQGARRARHPCEVGARRGPVRRPQRGGDGARPRRGGDVRHRGPLRRRPAQGRRARGIARRHALHRRGRRHAASRRRARCCACSSSRSSCASAAARRWPSTCASSPRPAATSSARSPRGASARICTTASTSCRCACPASPSGARTSPTSSSTSSASSAAPRALPRAASARTPSPCCRRTTGRATCASCATTSSG